MYKLNEDLSIYVTRGDAVLLDVKANNKDGTPYTFVPGDLVRFKVCKKKNTSVVVLQKDFPITTITQSVQVFLSKDETKIGTTISKPVDYWYEVELNPLSEPQTIIGYDEDGAKVFKLFPEGADKEVEGHEPNTEEEKLLSHYMDDKLDLSSTRPVENQVIARAIARLEAGYGTVADIVTPQMYGAIGDGGADDTLAIQKALDGGNVYFPIGVYCVTTHTARRLRVPSNRYIRFAKGAIIKGINNNAEVSSVFYIKDVDNVTIEGATIIGDIEENTSVAEGAGHGIHIQNSSNVTVKDCVIKNCFTDGVYTNDVTNVKVLNTDFDKCGRLACGTVCGENVLIEGCTARNNSRVAPMGGFFVEPNFENDRIKNVVIRNCVTENMGAMGYYATLRALNNGEDISVSFENCVDYGSKMAFLVGDFAPSVKHNGFVKVTNLTSINSIVGPVKIEGYSAENTPTIYFDGLTLINGNTSNQGISYGSAIVFTEGGGNIDFSNVRTENGGLMHRCLYTSHILSRVSVTNHDFLMSRTQYCVNYHNGIGDKATFNEATSTGFDYSVVNIVNASVDFYETTNIGAECELYFTGANSAFRVREHTVEGITTSASQYVRMTSDVGYMKIKKVSDTMFAVIAKSGTFAI